MTLQDIVDRAISAPSRTIAVASAADSDVLGAVYQASSAGIADFLLYGPRKEIETTAESIRVDISAMNIVETKDPATAATGAVQAVRSGDAQALMKGNVGTSILLREVLNKEYGLRNGKEVIAHVAVFELARYHKLLALTDGAMNIAPDLPTKVSMVNSAVAVMRALGVERPKVAVLAAVETVNTEMQATVDAALLAKMADRGQIKNCVIDGPLAMDNTISKESAHHKGIGGEVAGDADIIVAPELISANAVYKTINFLAEAKTAGMICGAKCPIVLTSRADSDQTKFLSIALSTIL
jgi:phosphate butyryltransferase